MKMSKTALKKLTARYRAVLIKGTLLNMAAALAVTGTVSSARADYALQENGGEYEYVVTDDNNQKIAGVGLGFGSGKQFGGDSKTYRFDLVTDGTLSLKEGAGSFSFKAGKDSTNYVGQSSHATAFGSYTSFIGNASGSADGGALSIGADATAGNDLMFIGNRSDQIGGAIGIADTASVTFNGNVSFIANSASKAGAFSNSKGTVVFEKNAVFVGNKAASFGALANSTTGTVTFKKAAYFFGNHSNNTGISLGGNAGGFFNAGKAYFLDNAYFAGNTGRHGTNYDSGALYNEGSLYLQGAETIFYYDDNGGNGIENAGSITIGGDTSESKVYVYSALTDAKTSGTVTVKNGTLDFGDTGRLVNNRLIIEKGSVRIDADNLSTDDNVYVKNGATLVLSNGTLTLQSGKAVKEYASSEGTVEIAAGTVGTKLAFLQTKVTVDADATLSLTDGGTIAKNISGDGTLQVADSTLSANADNLQVATKVSTGAVLSLTGGTITKDISGAGTTEIAGAVTSSADNIKMNMTVNNGQTLSLTDGTLSKVLSGAGTTKIASGTVVSALDNLQTTVTVDGTLALTGGGTLAKDIGGTGTLQINDGVMNAALDKIGMDVTVSDGATLSLTTGGTLGKILSGAGTTQVANGTLSADLAKLTTNVDVASGAVLSLTGGTITKDISGTGTTEIAGAVTSSADNIKMNMTVNNGQTLSLTDGTLSKVLSGAGTTKIASGTVVSALDNLQTTVTVDGTLALMGGGTLAKDIGGTGTLQINDGVMNAALDKIGMDVTVSDGATLALTTGGTLGKTLSGAGTTQVANGTLSADLAKLTTNVDVASGAVLSLTGGTITKDISGTGTTEIAGAVTSSADNIKMNMTVNNGQTLSLTDGTLSKTLSGDGTTKIAGNVNTEAVYLKTGTTVEAGRTLALTGGTVTRSISGTGITEIAGEVSLADGNILNTKTTVAETGTLNIGTQAVNIGANDITVNGTLTMTIAGIAANSVDYTGGQLITSGTVTVGTNAKLTLDIAKSGMRIGQSTGELLLISAGNVVGDLTVLSNNLYTVAAGATAGTYVVTSMTGKDIAELILENGGTMNNVRTGVVWDDFGAGTLSGTSETVRQTLNDLAQHDATRYVKALTALAPSDTMAIVTQGVNTMLTNAVAGRQKNLTKGRSGGTSFKSAGGWMQALYNHAKQDKIADNAGFTGKTAGFVAGYDAEIDDALSFGVGYGFNRTKVDSAHGKTHINGHTVFGYGKYQPADWYVRGIVNYGYARYMEQAYIGALKSAPHYDVRNIGAQVMTGYECENGLTPEAGVRYLRVKQNSYTDTAGQHIKTNANDILTAVAAVKYTGSTVAGFTPNVTAGVTYDVFGDNGKAAVRIADATYEITGKRLSRLGAEAGFGIEKRSGAWTFSAEYDLGLKEHFQSHSGLLKAKLAF